jgi:hypothetical protein
VRRIQAGFSRVRREARDLKVASADAAKRAVVDHFQQQLLAETRFEVSPLLIIAEQVKEFGGARARFYEVRRENLHIGGNIDRVFWVKTGTEAVLLVHPRRLGEN